MPWFASWSRTLGSRRGITADVPAAQDCLAGRAIVVLRDVLDPAGFKDNANGLEWRVVGGAIVAIPLERRDIGVGKRQTQVRDLVVAALLLLQGDLNLGQNAPV